jgi:phage/plasmid-associated DNA primase
LLVQGASNTGKSQLVYVLQHLVGTTFTCQLSVEHMDDPVMRAVIKGKALNIMTELSSTAMIADGGFKTLVSTEEPILINEKYKPAETYTSTAKHVIATNNLPAVNDKTEATYNRILFIPMLNVISKDNQDHGLKEKLSIGIKKGPLIGAQKGPPVWHGGGRPVVPVVNRRDPRAGRRALHMAGGGPRVGGSC